MVMKRKPLFKRGDEVMWARLHEKHGDYGLGPEPLQVFYDTGKTFVLESDAHRPWYKPTDKEWAYDFVGGEIRESMLEPMRGPW